MGVAFVYQNKLFLWECKVYYTKSLSGKKISDAVNKISSLGRMLGLQAISLVAIMTPFGKDKNRKNFIKDITWTMRVKKVFSLEEKKDKTVFIEAIEKIINNRPEK